MKILRMSWFWMFAIGLWLSAVSLLVYGIVTIETNIDFNDQLLTFVIFTLLVAAAFWSFWVCPVLDSNACKRFWDYAPKLRHRSHIYLVSAPFILTATCFLAFVLLTQLLPKLGVVRAGSDVNMTALGIMGIATAAAGIVGWWQLRITDRRLRDRARSWAICYECGYDLRGNPDAATCPECGFEIGVEVCRKANG